MSKRSSSFVVPSPKKVALATPPSTPQKSRIKDLTNVLTDANSPAAKKRLNFALSPVTPPTTPTKLKQTSVYSKAKALFQRSSSQQSHPSNLVNESSLVGREEESKFLNLFLVSSIESRVSSSLYISGPPGTGKTAQVNLSFQSIACRYATRVKIIKINCMTVSKPENIFHEIYCQLDTLKLSVLYTRKKTSKDLLEFLQHEHKPLQTVVLLLDELDYLITKDQQVLFQLFNFVSFTKLKTKIVVISISNALDLTDKFLPRLKSNNLSPESLQFFPYTSEQIKDVCIFKLKSLLLESEEDKENQTTVPTGFIPVIHPAAIQLCSRKSSSITGDLRKAFDICYKGIEMIENELRRKNEDIQAYDASNAPKVLISHIAKVCATSFGENILTRLSNLNLLQKAILCCLLNFESRRVTKINSNKNSVNQFFDYYINKTTQISEGILGTLKKGEFLEIVSALESTSLITISSNVSSGGNNNSSSIGNCIASGNGDFEVSNKLIRSNVLYIDVSRMIQEVGILERILNCD